MRKVFRPTTARIVSYVSGAVLVVLFIAITLAFPPEIRARFTIDQVGMLVLLLLFSVGLLHGIARSKVVADDNGLEIVNLYRKHKFTWAEVERISFEDGAPWPHAYLKNDERLMMIAIQSADGKSAQAAVNELRGRLG